MSIDRIGSGSTVLGSLSELVLDAGGDTNAALAALMLEHAQQKREMLGQARLAEEEFLQKREAEQVAHIREEAEEAAQAARMKAMGCIVSGGLGIAGGVMMVDGGECAESKMFCASGDTVKGGLDFAASQHDKSAGTARADATAADHRVGAAKRQLEEIQGEQNEARELMRNALDFLKELGKSRAEIDQAALLHRA